MERVRESSVHAILKQHSKNNMLMADHSKEKLRDRSHRQSPPSPVIVQEAHTVQLKASNVLQDKEVENVGGLVDFTP